MVYGFAVVDDVVHTALGGMFNQAAVHNILFKAYIYMLMQARAI